SPLLGLAAGATSRIARIVRPPQRLVGALQLRLRPLELTVEMANRGVGRRYMLLESRGIVAPFVDQQDRIGWGLAGAGPRAFRGVGVGARLAQPRELALGV